MSESLRIATFNLENLGGDGPGSAPLGERIDALAPMLLRLKADVLCLQEVNARHTPKAEAREMRALQRLLDATPMRGWPRAVTKNLKGEGPMDVHNLVTVSRFPFSGQRQWRHELVPPPAYRAVTAEPKSQEAAAQRWDRPILETAHELPDGRTLHVLNLHLRAPLAAHIPGQKAAPFIWQRTEAWAEGFFIAAMKRAGQALEARLAVDRLFDADADALIAVAGDLNADDREVPLRILIAGEEETGSGHLAARALVLPERSLPPSQRFSVRHHGTPQMLDHILASRQLMAHFQRIEVHNEALEDELVGYTAIDGAPGSFHAPAVAVFEVPEVSHDGR